MWVRKIDNAVRISEAIFRLCSVDLLQDGRSLKGVKIRGERHMCVLLKAQEKDDPLMLTKAEILLKTIEN